MLAPGVLVHAGPLAGLVLCLCPAGLRAAPLPQTAHAASVSRAALALPGDAIVRELGPDERHVYDVDVAAGETVRATALGADLARYRVVHFATPPILDSEHPGLSGIALSLVEVKGAAQDGFLRLQDPTIGGWARTSWC